MSAEAWVPQFDRWRHGGWYVTNVRYPAGGSGCVSRNYADRKWRIVCDPRDGSYPGGPNDHTYPNRTAAAVAEREITLREAKALRDSARCTGRRGAHVMTAEGRCEHCNAALLLVRAIGCAL